MRELSFVAGVDDIGERLDRACAARFDELSRSRVAALCDEGQVTLNDATAKPSARLREGDRVRIVVPPPAPLRAEPEAIPLEILHEDDALLVVNKPPGLVVHPARGHASGTLVNAILHHAELEDHDEALRPGIVHRLDKGTSGVMVVAKTSAAREKLKEQFQRHTIERAYVAVVQGVPPERVTYDTLHGRHPTDRMRFTSRVREGRRAVTHIERLEVLAKGRAALVRCRLETGRTHQIRMHLAEAGFPVLGDPLYGRPPRDADLRALATKLGHQALHAEVLGFVHPVTGASMRFEAGPPEDVKALIEALRGE